MSWGLSFRDDFNRADGAVGNGWTSANRSPSVLSNQFYDASGVVDSVGGVAVRDFGAANGRADITIKASSTVTGSCGVVFRWQDTANYWRAIFPRFTSGDAYYIQRIVGGVFTTPLIVSGNAAIDDRLSVIFDGDTLRLYVNGLLKGTVTDSTGSTRTTHGVYCSASTAWRVDDFEFMVRALVPTLIGGPPSRRPGRMWLPRRRGKLWVPPWSEAVQLQSAAPNGDVTTTGWTTETGGTTNLYASVDEETLDTADYVTSTFA